MCVTPIPDSDAQRDDVLNVLAELGLDEHVEDGLIEAMNKIDLLDPAARASLETRKLRNAPSVALSATTGEGCHELLEAIDRRLEAAAQILRLDVPLTDGKTLAWIYRRGEVLGRRDDNEAAHLSVRLSEEDIARLRHRQRLH